MDSRGIKLGRIAGIAVSADWSVLVVLWLITWSFADQTLPDTVSGYSTTWYWVAGACTAVLFLAGLLAHELAHSVVAMHRGVRVHDIRLWLLGGIATIESEPVSPQDDFAIAIAGPVMSAAIGTVALVAAAVLSAFDAVALVRGALVALGTVNIVLAVFNLAPAAPLDGGRLLRAWLWRRSGDRHDAALRATRAGRRFAVLLIGLGLVEFAFGGVVGGVWLAFLGWFVYTAARGEEMATIVRDDLGGLTVRDIMTPEPVTVPFDCTIAELLDDYLLSHRCSAFPVVAADGSVRGLVTLDDVRTVPRDARSTRTVDSVATGLAALPTVTPDATVTELLDTMQQFRGRRALVFSPDGSRERLVGIITPTDISHAVQRAEVRAGRALPPVPVR